LWSGGGVEVALLVVVCGGGVASAAGRKHIISRMYATSGGISPLAGSAGYATLPS